MIAARQMASARRQRETARRNSIASNAKHVNPVPMTQNRHPVSPTSAPTGSPARRLVDALSSVTSSPARSIASTISTSLPSSGPGSPVSRRSVNPSNPLASPARRVLVRSTSPNSASTSGSPAHQVTKPGYRGSDISRNSLTRQTALSPLSPLSGSGADNGLPPSYQSCNDSCLEPVFGGTSSRSSSNTSALSKNVQSNGVHHPSSLNISSNGRQQNGAKTSQFPPRGTTGLPRFAQLIPTPGTGGQFGALGIWPSPTQSSKCGVNKFNTVVRTRDGRNVSYLSDYSGSFERPNYGSVMTQLKEAYNETECTCDFLGKSFKICGKTVCVTILIGICLLFPVSMMSVGIKYLDECPIEPNIPIYLLVGGCFGFFRLISLLWRQVRSRRFEKMDIYEHDDENGDFITSQSSKFTDIILSIFLFIWFIFGNYWVIKIWRPPFVMDMHNPNYWCDEMCYYFAFAQILVIYGVTVVVILIITGLACCHRYACGFDEE